MWHILDAIVVILLVRQVAGLRPLFHFTPHFNWMNDPNGLAFVPDEAPVYSPPISSSVADLGGTFHMFYQANPNETQPAWAKGCTPLVCGPYWGHAISRDLVHWKEPFGNSSAILGDSGAAVLLSPALRASSGFSVVAFTGGQAMWTTDSLTMENWTHDTSATINDPMRLVPKDAGAGCCAGDNYAWLGTRNGEDSVYVLGGGNTPKSQGGGPQALLFRSNSSDLQSWEFVSVFYDGVAEDGTTVQLNCPDVFPLQDGSGRSAFLWLAHPPWHKPWIIVWMLGKIDDSFVFHEMSRGVADTSANFIASQSTWVKGRRVQYGWISTPVADGAVGSQSLPRVIGVSKDGSALTFSPAAEVSTLRQTGPNAHQVYPDMWLGNNTGTGNTSITLKETQSQTFELQITVHLGSAGACALESSASYGISLLSGLQNIYFMCNSSGWFLSIPCGGSQPTPVVPREEDKDHPSFNLRIFVDRTIVEVFLTDDRGEGASATTCSLSAEDPQALVVSLQANHTNGHGVLVHAESWLLNPATPWSQ